MPTVTLQAHYDGKQILLDEPFEIPPNARLMVTLLPGNIVQAPSIKPTLTAYQLAEKMGLVGAFEGADDLAEHHSHHLKEKLRAHYSG
ncbi:MAG: hypothetical protein WCI11_07120 [Candidatus Methylumidiphilus sp.]